MTAPASVALRPVKSGEYAGVETQRTKKTPPTATASAATTATIFCPLVRPETIRPPWAIMALGSGPLIRASS